MKKKYFTQKDAELMLEIAKTEPNTINGFVRATYLQCLATAIILCPSPKQQKELFKKVFKDGDKRRNGKKNKEINK